MRPPEVSGEELLDALVAPVEPSFAGGPVVVTGPPTDADGQRWTRALDRLATLPCVVVATGWPTGLGGPTTGSDGGDGPVELADVVVADAGELEDVLATVARAPVAATSLALHLRGSGRRTVADGLVAESALFSALQAGPEHRAWRAATPRRRRADGAGRDRIRVERRGDELRIALARPEVRNALDARMRDELLAALAVAEADPALSVVLAGEGSSFCSGGDLDEFGTAPDPATAHVVRLRASLAAVLARLADRTTVHLHGACAGSGVELAAIAGRVVADPGTTLALPELALGLIPGAGGTVSLPRRIGRHRTAWLALTGRTVDARVARDWGLVDELTP